MVDNLRHGGRQLHFLSVTLFLLIRSSGTFCFFVIGSVVWRRGSSLEAAVGSSCKGFDSDMYRPGDAIWCELVTLVQWTIRDRVGILCSAIYILAMNFKFGFN
jgi:hypothetical protein